VGRVHRFAGGSTHPGFRGQSTIGGRSSSKAAVAPERLLREERGLDLADLDRVAEDFHVVLLGAVRGAVRDGRGTDRDEMGWNRLRLAVERRSRPPTTDAAMGGRNGSGAGSQGSHAAMVSHGTHRRPISTSSGRA